jgi:hypothetical protein
MSRVDWDGNPAGKMSLSKRESACGLETKVSLVSHSSSLSERCCVSLNYCTLALQKNEQEGKGGNRKYTNPVEKDCQA